MTDFNDKQIEILQAAEKLFAEHGYDGTSVRDIAKSANINIAMISYYFGSKEKLLEALIIYRISDMRLQMENLYREDLTPLEKIDRLIELYIKRINQNKGMYQIIHFEISSGKIIHSWPELNSGKQISSIIGQRDQPPPLALDPENKRFAIASEKEITVVLLG